VMLERNVSAEFNWPINPVLRFVDVNSRRNTKFSKNMSFPEIGRVRLNPHEGREDPDRVIRRGRAQVVGVEEGGEEVVEVVGVVEVVDLVEEVEVEAGTPVIGQSRTRTKPRGGITTGSEVTTRRWRGEGRHLCR